MGLIDFYESARDAVGEVFDGVTDGLGTVVDAIGDAASEVFDDPLGAVGTLATGVWEGAGSVISGTVDGVGTLGDATIDLIGDTGDVVIDLTCEAISTLSGEKYYYEVKEYYENLNREKEEKQEELSNALRETNHQINAEIDLINRSRIQSARTNERFERIARSVANWKIRKYEIAEEGINLQFDFEELESHSQIFVDVNFDEEPIWNTIKGIATLGLLTRSQLNDVKARIKGMEEAFQYEKEQAEAENMRWNLVLQSVQAVRNDFDYFIRFYCDLLGELDYALDLLRQELCQHDLFFFSTERTILDPNLLPERHLRCLMACDKMARILCAMSKRKYITVSERGLLSIERDTKAVITYRNKFVDPLKQSMAS